MRSFLLIGLVALLAAAGGYLAYRGSQTGAAPELHGKAAPELRMVDLDGQLRTLEEFRGRWVLLNFWASWCAPCMDELPLLVETQSAYGPKGLQILGPALDEAESVRPIVQRFSINYPVFPDYASADRAMQALGNVKAGLPYSVLIDPAGRVADTLLGAFDADSLAKMLERHLGS